MIAAEDLEVGAVVRLASGSIKFVVTNPRTSTGLVALLGWADRVGVVRFEVSARALVWPRPAEAATTGPAAPSELEAVA